jgi:hypothetical protein
MPLKTAAGLVTHTSRACSMMGPPLVEISGWGAAAAQLCVCEAARAHLRLVRSCLC